MSEQLKHIFDSSACLSKRQLKDYVLGTMSREECYAFEHHVNTCFFCSEALDGMLEHSDALATVDQLNTGFLRDHFSLSDPQIHLNSLAPTAAAPAMHKRSRSRSRVQPLLLKPSSIAAALLLGFGVMWYLDFGKNGFKPRQVASASVASTTEQAVSSNSADMATNQQVAEEGLSPEASSSQGFVGNENTSGPVDDEPQKLQPLVVTDGKSSSEEKMQATQQKHVQVQPQSVAAAKAEPAGTTGAGNVAAMPTSKVEKLPARNTSVITPVKAAAPAATYESSGAADTRTHFSRQAADEGNSESSVSEGSEDNNDLAESVDLRAQNRETLATARNYVKNGQKDKAIKLLQSLVEEGNGPEKRQAKRLLKDLED